MDFLEKNLEEIIFNADDNRLKARGLDISGRRFRQLKIGNYGIADLVTANISCTIEYNPKKYYDITVYELKKDNVDIDTFLQALKYARGIISYLGQRSEIEAIINIVLIGRKCKGGLEVYLPCLFKKSIFNDALTGIGYVDVFEYSYDLDGLTFNKLDLGYRLANEGFNL